ncbi:hypothetical protein [Teredinibacter sp. KSP-S5-2]|uniref:hypothetical protein n=1 Tax=Teredinibacter sp. KSP-S5-2 TaxID=3034506 RepID=UPI00293514DA|nr:hypothetical protein [Teredinibacter sp. KSP-S5-2]WNO08100.1 hypothetical protein P5V12_14045 [Teredinibacter sp. KSP-S5-2]
MNERQRMQYMEAMGIDMFVPRYILPNSLPVQQCALPAEPAFEQARIEEPIAQPSAFDQSESSVVEQFVKINLDEPESKKPVEPVQSIQKLIDNVKAVVSDTPVEKAVFTLNIWHLENVFVLDSCQPGEALPTERLITNILIQLNLLPVRLPRAEMLTWPIVNSRPQDQSWEDARQMVSAFIDSRLETKPVEKLFLFGEEAFRALDSSGKKFDEQKFTQVSLEGQPIPAYVLPSLADLLRNPVQKKSVWQLLHSCLKV